MPELVSCILATRNRPRFFAQAVRCFLRQSYRPSELVVVDDGERPVERLCPRSSRVRYVRLPQPATTGRKLNIGIEHARGSILQKLDDDDYYHPDFLKLAVEHLPRRGRDKAVVAWDCFLVLFAGQRRARFSGHGWTAGGTLCFGREGWEKTRFRDVPRSVDSWFVRDHQPRMVKVCAPEHYILVRHGGNTWTRMYEGDEADDFLRTLPYYGKPLGALVGAEDLKFYRSLRYARSARTFPGEGRGTWDRPERETRGRP